MAANKKISALSAAPEALSGTELVPIVQDGVTVRTTTQAIADLVGGGGGIGTVTSFSFVDANGIAGSVATATTTPALTLSLGAITPSSVVSAGAVSGSNLSGTNTGDQTITLTGDVTGSGTGSFAATLANTAVTPGSYTLANITVDSKGRITAASNGSAGGAGTVTSVDTAAPAAGFTITGGPITGSGTFTFALADDLAAVEALATTGIVRRTALNTWTAGTAVDLATEVSGITPVANGGSGAASLTAYAPLFGGTTSTGAIQSGAVGTAGQVLTSNGAGAIATMQSQPFDVHVFYPGLPTASAKLVRVPVARAVAFAANFAGSYFKASANATASTVFDVQKNGSSIGTVTIGAGGTTATFATSGGSAQSLAAGDLLAIIAPASPDATLADPGFVLAGTR